MEVKGQFFFFFYSSVTSFYPNIPMLQGEVSVFYLNLNRMFDKIDGGPHTVDRSLRSSSTQIQTPLSSQSNSGPLHQGVIPNFPLISGGKGN